MPSSLLVAFVSLGCAPLEPEVRELSVRAHSIDATARCRIDADPDVTLRALGPFAVSNLTAERLPFRTSERTLTFPDDTQGVEAEASDGDRSWLGYSERRGDGIDVLLWERAVGCELFEAESYPGPHAGQAVGYSPEADLVLVAGGDQPASFADATASSGSLTFDAGTGAHAVVDPRFSFPQARAFATITRFGSELLLAGGENPLNTDDVASREARQSAAVYDPALGGFDGDVIELELARTRHAAVVLTNGDTLLVGGGRPRGDGTTVVVPPFEAISPSTRRSRVAGLAGLARARLEPVALRLDDGRILVGGGHTATGEPDRSLEWFSPDASTEVAPGTRLDAFPARHHRAFVALPGGGALTVGGCAPAGEQTASCRNACGDGYGCPAADYDAHWIEPNGSVKSLGLDQPLDCPAPFSPEYALLAPGSDGSPWLFAFDESVEPPCRAAFRFEPWDAEPKFGIVRVDIERWPDPRTSLTSLGPDIFVWLSRDPSPFLVGMRAGTRGSLSQNETLLGSDPMAPLVPLHLAPDRQPDGTPPEFPKALFREGRLILERGRSGNPPITVSVTDASYDDVKLTVGFDGDGPPLVVFGPHELGSESCPFPSEAVPPLVVTRKGDRVSTEDAAGRTTTCAAVPAGPLPVAFRAGATSSTLTALSIVRD
ncbi:MAG TPA: hypothetical protein VFZ53_16530 [Polyangiaceae bacterium]